MVPHMTREAHTAQDRPRTIAGIKNCMPRFVPGIVGVLAMNAAGCADKLPPLTFPQIQAVSQIGEYGRDRLRDGDTCRRSSTAVEGYVQCMEEKGWKFIARGNVYPAPECWSQRATGDPRQMPAAQCFDRASASGLTPNEPARTP
jgi:hypothetical protein